MAFTTAPVLRPFNRDLKMIMETDALSQAIARVLSQYNIENGVQTLHPVDHHAKVLSGTGRYMTKNCGQLCHAFVGGTVG